MIGALFEQSGIAAMQTAGYLRSTSSPSNHPEALEGPYAIGECLGVGWRVLRLAWAGET